MMSTTTNSNFRINYNQFIKSPQILLIDEEGNRLGVYPTREALALAQSKGLDLIEVNGRATPVVCKIMDYGKYKYDLQKKEKAAQKIARENKVEIKDVIIHPTTNFHDLETKSRHILKWLEEGNKVKITVEFRRRELQHTDVGMDNLNNLLAFLDKGLYVVEEKPLLSGKYISMLISRQKQTLQQQ